MNGIHVAYAISKHGYRARAYVLSSGVKHTFTTGLGDSANEAMAEAIKYIEQRYQQDELLAAPSAIHYHGRMSGAIIDASAF